MWESLWVDNGNFERYSFEHNIALIVCSVLILLIFLLGRYTLNENRSRLLITVILSIGMFLQLIKPIIRSYQGVFDPTEDFPLHLCNVMAVFMPFIMYFKWRIFWGVAFFWVIGGTTQALITPTLTDSFPHYEYFRYWIVHSFLPASAIFAIIVYGWRINWKDMIRSMIGLNIFALLVTPINLMLDGNYLYLREKPPGDTIYNFLGSWPYYILSLEVLMIVLFACILLFFSFDKVLLFVRNKVGIEKGIT